MSRDCVTHHICDCQRGRLERLERENAELKRRLEAGRCREELLASTQRENEALRRTLSFFASVIKSGEPWTEECERAMRALEGAQR